ncbi:MAG: hypothetical protein WBC05_17695 [Sedimentisphaerales bacterium]
MIRSKKNRFVISFILACVCATTVGAEPDEAKTNVIFEINNKQSKTWVPGPTGQAKGPIKPTHVAVFYVRRPWNLSEGHTAILQILKTYAGQSLSEQQRNFLAASDAVVRWGIENVQNHDMLLLYAVSEEEAKKMAQAYLEVPTNKANERIQEYEKYLKERKERIIEINKILPEKQKQADQMEPKYMEIKNKRYFSLSDDEAYQKAKETMLEMDKMLDVLEIELAGIREKMSVINEYRKTPQDMQAIMRREKLPEGMLVKLEQMFVEQTIELKSVEAREQAATKIRGRDKAFVNLFIQWKNLSGEVHNLKANLESSEKRMREMEERLTNPTPDMLPPEIYQNKVAIYPVLTER